MSRPKLFLLLNRARARLMARMNRECIDELDVSVSQLAALFALAPGPKSAGALARQLELDAGAATRAVDRLIAKQLVARQADPADARRRHVALTGAGRARLERGYAALDRANALLREGFTAAELDVVARFLAHAADVGTGAP